MFSGSDFRSQERRRRAVAVAIGLAVGYLVLTAGANLWTDYLWFDSIGYVSVWSTNLLTGLWLGIAGVVVSFGFVLVNLVVSERLSPRLEALELSEDEELVERFREWAEPRLRWVRLAIAGMFAVLLGVSVADWRSDVLLFMNATPFGQVDPQFGLDLSFFMFRLPLWSQMVGWAFNLVVLTTVLVAALHYLNGGIRLQRGSRPVVRTGVKTHLSILAAGIAVLRAVSYRIDAYEIVYSQHIKFYGAGYTDVNARLPALNLLVVVSLVAALFFLWNVRQPGWTLALVSVSAWLFVSFAAGVAYPSLIQRFRVAPNELDREGPFIARSIEATRAAYGLDRVERRSYAATANLELSDIEANRTTIDNIRLWDPVVLIRTYQNLQEIRPYYRVDRVDTDRYVIDGEMVQVMVAARELDEASLPAVDWQSTRLNYTHGFGVVLSPANRVEADGQPTLLVRDIPPVSELFDLEQTRTYFGESYEPGRWLIVGAGDTPVEVDIPLQEGFAENEYEGLAGIPLDNIWKRLAFALRFRDLNLLISSQLTDDSRLLLERNVREIVERIAPFLVADADPYPVLIEGRLVWMLDLYTISGRYPYSQPWGLEETERLARQSGVPRRGFNYIRNSVKATIDAYDGTVRFFATDPSDWIPPDPLLATWRSAYPGLVVDQSELAPGLIEHLRYPQDMFKIQGEMYQVYHMTETQDFFQRVDAWSIPDDPATVRRTTDLLWGDVAGADPGSVAYLGEVLPQYLPLELPGDPADAGLSFVLAQPFNPQGKNNMASLLVADSTPGRYGRLIDYWLPPGSVVEGVSQVGQRINQDDEISQQFTLWNQEGSGVVLGDMLVIPIEDSIVYVQAVFLEAEAGGLPEFRRVVIAYANRIEWDETLEGAFAKVFGEGTTSEPPPSGEPPPTGDDQTVIGQARALLEMARDALLAGDLGEYQRLVEEALTLLMAAEANQEAALGLRVD